MKNWKAAAVLCGIGVCLTGCAAGAKTDKAVPQQGEAVGGQKRMKIWFDTGGAPGESYGTVLQNGAAAAAKELEPGPFLQLRTMLNPNTIVSRRGIPRSTRSTFRIFIIYFLNYVHLQNMSEFFRCYF